METSATQILDREFLELRARILELAASFDRVERAQGTVEGDQRWDLLQQGLEVLLGSQEERARAVQLLFSLSYDPDWREKYGLNGNVSNG